MSSISLLLSQAAAKRMRADRCHSVADTLSVRGAAMSERLEPVKALHVEQVWKGRAASFSRVRLNQVIAGSLHHCADELRSVEQALRDEADELRHEAVALGRRARSLAEIERREEIEREQELEREQAQEATPQRQ